MYDVYIIDDDKLIVKALLSGIPWLENGFNIVGARTNPEAALEEITALKPHVIFCDLKMPRVNGIELMRRVKENGIDAEFVLLSAYGEFEASREFFLLGGFDYLLKPLNQNDAGLVLEKLSRKLNGGNRPAPKPDIAPTNNESFDALVAYVTANFNKKHSLKDLSQMFFMNPTYICNLFAKHYGSTLTMFITDLRMIEAARLLVETDRPLKNIAADCGYANYYHFCKVFKSFFGMSTSEYKENKTPV